MCGDFPNGPKAGFGDDRKKAYAFAEEQARLGFATTVGLRTDRNGENQAWEPVKDFEPVRK